LKVLLYLLLSGFAWAAAILIGVQSDSWAVALAVNLTVPFVLGAGGGRTFRVPLPLALALSVLPGIFFAFGMSKAFPTQTLEVGSRELAAGILLAGQALAASLGWTLFRSRDPEGTR